MKNLLLILVMLMVVSELSAQNLVSNGDFSLKSGSGCSPKNFVTPPLNWSIAPTGYTHSPDFYHSCAGSSSADYPGSNWNGCADPLAGSGYIGARAFPSATSPLDFDFEYVYQQLSTALVSGTSYYIEFYVRPADINGNNSAVKTLGMHLTNDTNQYTANAQIGLHHLLPQIKNTTNGYYNNVNDWVKISGTYTPLTSGVKYIVIGNFDEAVNSGGGGTEVLPGHSSTTQSYYYFDGVTIIPVGQPIPDYPTISGSSTVCTSNSTYTLSNYNSLATVTWQATPSSLFTTSSGSGATANLQANSSSVSGSGSLTFTIQGVCDSDNINKTVWVGKPSNILNPEDLSGPSCMLLGTFDDFLGTPWPVTVPGADSYEPSIIFGGSYHGITFYSEINRVRVQVTVASNASMGLYTMQVAPKNICGYGSAAYATFQTTNRLYNCDTGGGVLFSVSPNPTGNELEVKYTDKETGIILSYDEFDEPVEYVVTDLNANIVFSKTSKKTRHTLNLSSIKEDGIYILSAYYGENLGAEQVRIVIER